MRTEKALKLLLSRESNRVTGRLYQTCGICLCLFFRLNPKTPVVLVVNPTAGNVALRGRPREVTQPMCFRRCMNLCECSRPDVGALLGGTYILLKALLLFCEIAADSVAALERRGAHLAVVGERFTGLICKGLSQVIKMLSQNLF